MDHFRHAEVIEQPLKDAVHNPRFHFQWKPNILYYENGAFEEKLLNSLKSLGHETKSRDDIGQVEAIIRLENGKLEGVADWRGDDSAGGF